MNIVALTLSISLSAAAPLLAQTVVLNVPVEVTNMPPQAKGLELRANFVYKGKSLKFASKADGTEWNVQRVPLVNGAFSGTVPIKLALQNSAPSQIAGYGVTLYIYSDNDVVDHPGRLNGGNTWAQAKPGTKLVYSVTGTFGPDDLAPGAQQPAASPKPAPPR